MAELTVAILAVDEEQRTVLRMQVDATTVARTAHSFSGFPVGSTDPMLRRIHDLRPDVLILDMPAANPAVALRAIELLHLEVPKSVIFVIGDMSQPQNIVSAMRSGAREYMERPTSTTALLEAFVRLTAAQRKSKTDAQRGRVFTVINAKGGNGATTIAVNTALALQSTVGNVALVDLAPLGHAALHLNLRPSFSVLDAIHNLHRLDDSLLDTFMAQHDNGMHVLAGTTTPFAEPSPGEFARLFDVLVNRYRCVVVDASSRLDACTRVICDLSDLVMLVAHTDVASLWSAARVREYLSESGSGERVRLVLNRFRKISGFSESDVETATSTKLFWKIPNQFPAVSSAIDRGIPVIQQNHSEIARCFVGLAAALTEAEGDAKRRSWSLFRTAERA
ncbi:MAG: CpaE family protein [Terriglobales bacterium]